MDKDLDNYLKFKQGTVKLDKDLDIIQLIRRNRNHKTQFDRTQRALVQYHHSQLIGSSSSEAYRSSKSKKHIELLEFGEMAEKDKIYAEQK